VAVSNVARPFAPVLLTPLGGKPRLPRKPADFALDYPVQAWATKQSKLKRRTGAWVPTSTATRDEAKYSTKLARHRGAGNAGLDGAL
jgi:hypothetical protein